MIARPTPLPARARGFSLLELAVTVSIVGILAGALLTRVIWYQGEAEHVAREQVVGVLRSALGMKVGQLMAQGKQQELSNLLTLNPMELLAQKPANYLGEVYSPQIGKISRGNWYFNRKKLLLVYIAKTGATIQNKEPKQYFYQVQLLGPLDGASGLDHADTSQSTTIEGIVLTEIPAS